MRIFMHKRERFQTCYEKQIRATGSKGEKRAGKMGNGYENLQDMGKEEMRRDAGEAKKAGIPAGPISVNLSTFCAGTKGLAGEEDLLFEITETAKEEEENREIWRFAK